jgi:hypothetical protein
VKIKFNPDLDFQADAVSSIVDLFEGQETCQTNFTVASLDATIQLGLYQSDLGIGNRLKLLDEDILSNVGKVQLRNGLNESMNKRIPNGAYCVWRLHPAGSQGGKIVIAQHRDIHAPEFGGRYTVKVFESEKEHFDDGTWRQKQIVLKPLSRDPSFEPIVLWDLEESELEIIAELVEVLA